MPYQHETSLGRLTQLASKSIGHRLDDLFAEAQLPYTAEHWTVLSYLHRYSESSQKEIAFFTGKDKVTLKRLLDKMEAAVLLSRTTSLRDRRYNVIALTTKGEKVFEQLAPYAEQALNEATTNLQESEIEACKETLETIIANLTR